VDKLERIAGRVARAVGPEQSPEEILESASLVAELASEFEEMMRNREEPAAVSASSWRREKHRERTES
jgi:hypothetical protein